MTDDYDRRKDDRIEAGLCQWCGHAPHEDEPCAVFLSGPAFRRPCKCGSTSPSGRRTAPLPPLGGFPIIPPTREE